MKPVFWCLRIDSSTFLKQTDCILLIFEKLVLCWLFAHFCIMSLTDLPIWNLGMFKLLPMLCDLCYSRLIMYFSLNNGNVPIFQLSNTNQTFVLSSSMKLGPDCNLFFFMSFFCFCPLLIICSLESCHSQTCQSETFACSNCNRCCAIFVTRGSWCIFL